MPEQNNEIIKSIELTIHLSDSRTAVVNKNESIVKLSEGIFTFEESQEILSISKKFFDFIDNDGFINDDTVILYGQS